MPITISPKLGWTIEGATDKPQTFEYHIKGDTDYNTVLATFLAYLPTTFNLVKLLKDYNIREVARNLWIGTATYEMIKGNEPGQEDPAVIPIEFELGSETIHLDTSLETIASYASANAAFTTAPNFKRAVQVTKDGVQGYDMEFSTFSWSETYFQSQTLIQSGYLQTLRDLRGKTNTNSFRGFEPYEAVFLGATGRTSEKFAGYWEMNYKFIAGENISLTPDGFTSIDKKAHELLWYYCDRYEDTTAGTLITIPLAAYVERIRDAGNFSTLSLPI